MMSVRQALMLAGLIFSAPLWGQVTFTLSGSVSDTNGDALPGAAVLVEENLRLGMTTDAQGKFRIEFPSLGPWTVKASFVGHSPETWTVTFDETTVIKHFRLVPGTNLREAEVIDNGPSDVTVQKIDPRLANKIPTPREPSRTLCFRLQSISRRN